MPTTEKPLSFPFFQCEPDFSPFFLSWQYLPERHKITVQFEPQTTLLTFSIQGGSVLSIQLSNVTARLQNKQTAQMWTEHEYSSKYIYIENYWRVNSFLFEKNRWDTKILIWYDYRKIIARVIS